MKALHRRHFLKASSLSLLPTLGLPAFTRTGAAEAQVLTKRCCIGT